MWLVCVCLLCDFIAVFCSINGNNGTFEIKIMIQNLPCRSPTCTWQIFLLIMIPIDIYDIKLTSKLNCFIWARSWRWKIILIIIQIKVTNLVFLRSKDYFDELQAFRRIFLRPDLKIKLDFELLTVTLKYI